MELASVLAWPPLMAITLRPRLPLLMSRQLPWLPRHILTFGGEVTGVRALITARVGLRRVTTAIVITVVIGAGSSRNRSASLEGIL